MQKTQLQLRGSSLGPPAPPPRGIWRGHKPAYWPGWGVVIRRRCRPRCPAWAAPGQQVPVPLQGQLWAWGGAAGVQGPVTTPCWQPADGSRISRVNGWAPASRLRFQGCWKASGVGQGNVCFGLQGQEGARARRRQAKLSAARGKALSALGGVWTGAAYLGTAAWPVGTLRLCVPGRQRAWGQASSGTCREKGGQASAGGARACRGGRCPPGAQGRKGHPSGASSTSPGADGGEPGPSREAVVLTAALRPPAGRRQASTGGVGLGPGRGRAEQEGGLCWAQ